MNATVGNLDSHNKVGFFKCPYGTANVFIIIGKEIYLRDEMLVRTRKKESTMEELISKRLSINGVNPLTFLNTSNEPLPKEGKVKLHMNSDTYIVAISYLNRIYTKYS